MHFLGRMNSRVLGAFVFLLLSTNSKAQIPAVGTQNCGAFLSSIISVCSHPTLSRPDWCCNELKKWNDARCWCEANAFNALDTVSSNGYAFSFRDGFCGEAYQRPALGRITPEQATCDPFESIAESDPMEQCSIPPEELRAQRYVSLDALRDDKAADAADLSPWFLRMDTLFTEEASYELVGIFLGQGRFEVKQYFMTRQEAYGFEPMTSEFTGEHFWRAPNIVSYSGGATTASGQFNKREFVTFEACSPRIAAVHSLEDNYQSRYSQIWDARATRLLTRYDQTAAAWCQQVSERCEGEDFPYTSMSACVAFHATLQAEGRVTCNKFEQSYVPQYAIHGDTLACRTLYLDLSSVTKTACPAIGPETSQSRCDASQCSGNAYIDPFARDATTPQYESSATFSCSETSCSEDWPSQAQIDMIPSEEQTRFGTRSASNGIPRMVIVSPSPTPVAAITFADSDESASQEGAALAADNDDQIDEDFENTNIPQSMTTAPESGFLPGTLNA